MVPLLVNVAICIKLRKKNLSVFLHFPLFVTSFYIEKHKTDEQEIATKIENIPPISFEQSMEKLVRPTGSIRTKKTFDYNQFKIDYKAEYQRIRKERTNAFNSFKDIPNYKAQLENSIKGYCEQWFRAAYK